jgi:hypothetical protein
MSVDIASEYRDGPTCILQEARGTEPHNAAANDRYLARGTAGDFMHRKGR